MLTILLDMDGVIADLDSKVRELYGEEVFTSSEAFEKALVDLTDTGGFSYLSPMPRADDIAEFVLKNQDKARFEILTNHGSFYHTPHEVGEQKQEFLFLNFFDTLHQLHFNMVSTGVEKANYADQYSILIDDRKKNCKAFESSGGKAFIYTVKNHDKIFKEVQKLIDEHIQS